MKKTVLLLIMLTICLQLQAQQMAGKFGIGISAGEPTGVSMKYWLNKKAALEGVVGYSIVNYYDYYDDYYYEHYNKRDWKYKRSLYLHLDYLMHHNLVKKLYFTYGVGGKIVFHEDVVIGMRIPLGLNYIFTEVPLDVSLDIVPVLNLLPATDFRFDPSISLRFNL